MRMFSFASIVAALIVLIGGALATPALAQTDGTAAAAPAAGGDAAAPAKKKKRSKKSSADAGTPDAAAAADGAAAKDGSKDAAAAAPAAPADATASKSKSKRKKKKGQADAAPPPAPAPPANGQIDLLAPPPSAPPMHVTIKTPAEAPPPAPTEPADSAQSGPYDDDAPTIAHTPITKAMKNKPLVFSAHIIDPAGVFQPVLYLRKHGTGDYLPIKMIGSKLMQGDYAVEVDAKLISVDLDYYIECYDNLGNGPARVGSPESPLTIKLEEEKKAPIIVGQQKVEEKHVGAPPAISHSTIARAYKGQPIEINAKLVGDTGVSQAKVFFRHVGEREFHTLPMGNIGGDDYTATMPASVVTNDLEYYLEAFDQYGNGPGRSGGPNVPYQITVTEKPIQVEVRNNPVDLKPQPHLVKLPFSPNPGRWAGWVFMGTFVASTIIVGGELYGGWQADQAYQQQYNYNGQLDGQLHERTLDYDKRAKIAAISAGASLAISITLLLIFPAHPETQMVTGSGGDAVLAHF